MTKQRNLKSRIRERMAAADESYVTARMHVLNERPARGGAAARWRGGVHHATVALAGQLDDPPSEALLWLVGGGVGAGVFAFRYDDFSSLFLAGRHLWQDDAAWLDATAERLGRRFERHETSGSVRAKRDLDALLDGGPVIAFVDQAGLGYREGVEAYYCVTVLATDGDEVLLGDLPNEPLRMPREQLLAARGRIRKFHHRLMRLEPGPTRLDRDAVLGGLRACVAQLRDPGMGNQSRNFTLDTFAALAERMRGAGGERGWERVFPLGDRRLVALRSIYEYAGLYDHGGGLGRALFARGLREAAEGFGLPELLQPAELYTELAQAWTELADAALPPDVPLLAEARGALDAAYETFLDPGERTTADDATRPETPDDSDTYAALEAVTERLAERLERIAPAERAALDELERALPG